MSDPKSAQILLTNYGWNHPNQTHGLSFARSIRQTQLLEGIVKHRLFRPVSWDKVSAQPINITTYVFLDIETCFESNWPTYDCCKDQTEALSQPIFQSPHTQLVLFDCSGSGVRYCSLNERNVNKTTVVSISATSAQHSDHDLGLPPPAGNPINMTQQERQAVQTCSETSRPLLFTFAGALARGDVRPKLKPLHNGKDVLVLGNTREARMTYDQFLLSSKFAGVPKGDELFSYRFTEAMSAGAIPVVHADDWVLPFSKKLIHWEKCAVRIPEAQVNDTISILSRITAKQRCEMRKCVMHAYHRFMRTPERTIAGIITSLQLMDNNSKRKRRRRRRL